MTHSICTTLSDSQFQIWDALPKGTRSKVLGITIELLANMGAFAELKSNGTNEDEKTNGANE